MKKLAAEPKLMACLVAIVVMTTMLGVGSYVVLSRVNRTFKVVVNSTARKLWLAGDLRMAAGDMVAAQRRILLYANTPDAEADGELFEVWSAQVDRDTAELRSLPLGAGERNLVGMEERSNGSYREVVERIEREHVFDMGDRREVAESYKRMDEVTNQLNVLESNALKDALDQTQTSIRYGRIALGAVAVIAMLVVLLALRTVDGMGDALRAAAAQARASADEVLAAHVFLKSVVNAMPCAVCIFDAKGNLKRWNKNFLGYSFEEMRQTGILDTVEPESVEAVKQTIVKTLVTGMAETEAYLRTKDGRRVPTYLAHRRFMYEGEPCILGVGIDISRQKRAEQYGRLQRVALESASEGIVITDAAGRIEWANPAFTSMTGYELEEVLGANPRLLKSGMMDRAFYKILWETILDGEKWSGELWNLKKDGNVYCEEMHIAPVRAVDERISNFVAVKHDITQRKQAEQEAERAKEGLVLLNKELREANEHILKISQTDPLTGLANRRTLDARMRHELARAERLGCGFSVILGDLDHFKQINDEFGHLVGDRVLVATAGVLSAQARPYDLPARFGGEEFLVLLPESTLADAMTIAQRIRLAITNVATPECRRQITMSLGISTWGQGDTAGALVGRADAALYQAKKRGRNRVVAQTSDMPPTIAGHVLAGETADALVKTA